jgi:hypothetical protein
MQRRNTISQLYSQNFRTLIGKLWVCPLEGERTGKGLAMASIGRAAAAARRMRESTLPLAMLMLVILLFKVSEQGLLANGQGS